MARMGTNQLSMSTPAIANAFRSGSSVTGNKFPKFFQLGATGCWQMVISPNCRRKSLWLLVVRQMPSAPSFTLSHGTAASTAFPTPIPSQIVYLRVLRYLGKLAEAEWRTKAHPILARFSRASDLVAAFKNQFHSYSLLCYPFDKPLAPGQSVRSWWCSMLENPDANVLAVSSCLLVDLSDYLLTM
jgi:hypothetical protein